METICCAGVPEDIMVTISLVGAGDELLYLGELCNMIEGSKLPWDRAFVPTNFIILARRGYAKFRGFSGVSRPKPLKSGGSNISYLISHISMHDKA